MINEETLTFYYYGDGLTAGERHEVAAALREDAELAARYTRLEQQLEQWRQPDTHRAPALLVQRWHDGIDEAAGADRVTANDKTNTTPFHFLSFAWGSAAMAVLALAIGIGVYFSGDKTDVDGTNVDELLVSVPVIHEPDPFKRGLKLHLQESQRHLVSLPGEAAENRILLVMRIIDQNRMFERAAKRNNSPRLARVLRAFEPVLTRLATENISSNDAAALRAQLTFELNVVLTKLAEDTSDETHSISISI
ncbi:MAG: hypothetical protein O7E57_06160 [Gammaproteobacteria bacterium]|nr:hypothetical protein [Gammaproteobacteria bacterium]